MNIPLSIPRFDSRSINSIRNDINDELEFHIQCRIDDLVSEGFSCEEATKKAQLDFGCTEAIKKQCEQIDFGGRRIVAVLAGVMLVLLTTLVGWLTWQLWLTKGQNAEMAQRLLATASSEKNLPTTALQELNDLTGTVTGPDGPVDDAKVLLIYKSWPHGSYQQDALVTTTDEQGNFAFEDLYSTNYQTAYLVSIVKDGFTLESKYWVHKRRSKVRPVKMKVKEAVEKVLTLMDDSNQPLANTDVFLKSRNTRPNGSGGDMIYEQSSNEIMLTTDDEGKVDMSFFAANDKAIIAAVIDGRVIDIPFQVNAALEQVVGGQSDLDDVKGKVVSEDGSPVKDANVLLVHKDWANGYRQKFYKTKTDNDGKFVFPNRYDAEEKYAFLVSVIADGWTMQSQYVFKQQGGKQRLFRFKLQKAVTKNFVFKDTAGHALDGAYIFASDRKTKGGDEHMIYSQSGPDIAIETGENGSAAFNFFALGDTVTFQTEEGEQAKVKIDDNPVQHVTVKKN